MTITSRYPTTCGKCRQPIAAGAEIDWERGKPATHPQGRCPTTTAPEAPRLAVEDAGVYVLPDGAIVKVQANQDKTRTYAKRWTVIGGVRATEAGTREHGEYVFEAGLVQQVAATGRRMDLEEAKAFILRFGVCCRCGRGLKDATSVERGIGPVCVKYFTGGTTGAQLLAS